MDKNKHIFYPYLNSLRAFACIIVILFHSNTEEFLREAHLFNPFVGGFIGVDLFFVLSGFLITTILVRQYGQIGRIKIVNFYKRRILRLYPPIIIAVCIFLIPLLFFDKVAALSNMFFVMTYTGDIVMVFRKLFPVLQYPLMFSHCWSLSIEEQFYIFYPFLLSLLFLFYKKKKKTNLISSFPYFNLLFILLIFFGTLILKDWFYKFFLWRFFEIFFGAYIALIYSSDYFKDFGDTKTSSKIKNAIIYLYSNKYVFILAVVTFLFFTVSYSPIPTYNLQYYLITVASSILIVNAVQERFPIYIRILANKQLQYLGKISYGIYLYHFPIFYLKNYFFMNTSKTLLNAVGLDIISMGVILLISGYSYKLIEKPVLAFKDTI